MRSAFRASVAISLAATLLLGFGGLCRAQPPVQTAIAATAAPGAPGGTISDADDQAALKLFQPVEALARSWLSRPEIQRSLVGVEIMDVNSGRVLFSHNGHKRFVSASIAKVLTCACAYELLGGEYRYKTTLYGYGDLQGGRLNGQLVLVPSQDPSFSTNSLNTLTAQLAAKVKAVSGVLHVAQVPGGGDYFASEWLIQDWGQAWMPASSDLVIDRNVAVLNNLGRGYPVKTTGADAENSALTRSLLKGPWASAWVSFEKSSNSVTFHRPDAALQNEPVVANPGEYNAAIVRAALKNCGITFGGKDGAITGTGIVLAQDSSPPLAEIAKFCLEHSDNLYAQQLLRTIGTLPPVNTKLQSASLEDRGLARLTSWLSQSCGVSPAEAVLFDGCGLSRKNAITPHALNMVLRHMGVNASTRPFLELLKGGYDPSAKTFKYKTGAMDSVRSVSGIVRTATGQPIAVTIIINAHTPSVRELRGTLVSLVAKIEALGALKLKPAPAPAPAVQKKSAPRSNQRAPQRRPARRR